MMVSTIAVSTVFFISYIKYSYVSPLFIIEKEKNWKAKGDSKLYSVVASINTSLRILAGCWMIPISQLLS